MNLIILFPLLSPGMAAVVWFGVAIILALIELTTPGLFFFLALACGALAGAAVALCHGNIATQLVVSLMGTLVMLVVLRWYIAHRHLSDVRHGHGLTNIDALIGARGTVIQTVEGTKPGYVKIRQEEWPARALGLEPLHAGTTVIVVKIEGNRLFVRGIT